MTEENLQESFRIGKQRRMFPTGNAPKQSSLVFSIPRFVDGRRSPSSPIRPSVGGGTSISGGPLRTSTIDPSTLWFTSTTSPATVPSMSSTASTNQSPHSTHRYTLCRGITTVRSHSTNTRRRRRMISRRGTRRKECRSSPTSETSTLSESTLLQTETQFVTPTTVVSWLADIAWLDKTLETLSNSIVASHHNLLAMMQQYLNFREVVLPIHDNAPPVLRDLDSFVDVLARHDVSLLLTGHLHIPFIAESRDVRKVTTLSTQTFPKAIRLSPLDPTGRPSNSSPSRTTINSATHTTVVGTDGRTPAYSRIWPQLG